MVEDIECVATLHLLWFARGDFLTNMIHGKGVMKYANGDEYNGQWTSGLVCVTDHY